MAVSSPRGTFGQRVGRDVRDQIAERVDRLHGSFDSVAALTRASVQSSRSMSACARPSRAGIEPQAQPGRHRRHDVAAVKRGRDLRQPVLRLGSTE